MQIFNLYDKQEYIKEVMKLEHDEWGENPTSDRKKRIKNKIAKYFDNINQINYCKLILIENYKLVGFISIFPHDCEEKQSLSPWYATMFVKKEYRGKGYSKVLNDAIISEAKKRNIKELYLKTELNNYYEKFGAIFVKSINDKENIFKFIIIE